MSSPLFIIDAFTGRPFGGNPAAVVLLEPGDPLAADGEDAEALRLNIAGEMNLSETAFVTYGDDRQKPASESVRGRTFGLRWYTPTREVDLCGHATLASAHALYDAGLVSLHQPIEFDTRSGRLRASPDTDWRGFWIDLPATPPVQEALPDGLLDALGLTSTVFAGRSTPADGVDDGSANDFFDWFIEVDAESEVARLDPTFRAISNICLEHKQARGVIVSAKATRDDAEVVSRCFYPAYGVDEDPVTGSAHCTVGPFFARELGKKDGEVLHCRQISRRGGEVRVTTRGKRVHLGGRATTVVRGKLVL
ncbi:MAG: PhzF family phenazine biosynthesis protein [Planctomycetota bacterium]